MEAKQLEKVEDIEFYYVQIIQTFYQWMEFIEHWILKVNMLPVDQYTEQCKVCLDVIT